MDESNESADWEVAEARAEEEEREWPFRPLVLALLGLATGIALHFIAGPGPDTPDNLTALRLASLAGLLVTSGMIAFTIERRLWWAAILFALVCGGAAAGVVWWNGAPQAWSGGDGWRIFSLFLSLAIAAPLFQAARDADPEGPRLPYASVHDHAWTNIVLWFACWAFVSIVFALMWLLAGLFDLIDLRFLRDLLGKQWFVLPLAGLAFGGAAGLFREHDVVVRLLQRVVASVLAVLAPVLAVGLALFLLALPFTGLGPLWKAWVSATPLLLVCVVGSVILANAVIGNSDEQQSRLGVLRYGAMLLAVVMLPLAVLAAVATGMRIGQYGFTPERLWALTFVVVASAFGLAYLVSLVRGRMGWAAYVRPANLHLAVGLFLLTLFLATPLVSFNAISTRDQVARLESGKTPLDKFDWQALAFDFGKPGRDALKKLAESPNAKIREQAGLAANVDSRWDLDRYTTEVHGGDAFAGTFVTYPAGTALPPELKAKLVEPFEGCSGKGVCRVYFQPDGKTVLAISDNCANLPASQRGNPKILCMGSLAHLERDGAGWKKPDLYPVEAPVVVTPEEERALAAKELQAIEKGEVTVRTVQQRQIFVGDKPYGKPFD